MARKRYPTDLTEGQWAQRAPLLPPPGIGLPLRLFQAVCRCWLPVILRLCATETYDANDTYKHD